MELIEQLKNDIKSLCDDILDNSIWELEKDTPE